MEKDMQLTSFDNIMQESKQVFEKDRDNKLSEIKGLYEEIHDLRGKMRHCIEENN